MPSAIPYSSGSAPATTPPVSLMCSTPANGGVAHDGADDLGALLQVPGDAGEQAAHPEPAVSTRIAAITFWSMIASLNRLRIWRQMASPRKLSPNIWGRRLSVRGISSRGDTRTRMKVRSIETISETCAPQQRL